MTSSKSSSAKYLDYFGHLYLGLGFRFQRLTYSLENLTLNLITEAPDPIPLTLNYDPSVYYSYYR